MCLNQFVLVDHVFQRDFFKRTENICAGVLGAVDQVFKQVFLKER